jgi:AraC-like DNA-binding protein
MDVKMSVIRDLLYCALPWGVNIPKVCQEAGIDPAELYDGGKMVDYTKSDRVWEVTSKMTNDPLIGLHIGEGITPMLVGKIGHFMQSSNTAMDAVDIVCKYGHTFCTLTVFKKEVRGQSTIMYFDPSIVWEHENIFGATQSLDFAMSSMLKLLSTLTGRKILPVKVELLHPKKNLQEYERVYRCPVTVGALRNCIVFRNADMEAPVLSKDQSLFAYFSQMLETEIEAIGEDQGFTFKVKRLLFTEFKAQIPPVEVIASHLNVTTRTFQRKLTEEKTCYRDLCNQVKKEFALKLMERPKSRVSEVADVLGYSDTTAFRRAFKSWVNYTPKEIIRNSSNKLPAVA